MFSTILKWHAKHGHLQYLSQLAADLEDTGDHDDQLEVGVGRHGEDMLMEFSACELGIRYPTLQAIKSGRQHVRTKVLYDEI